MTRYLNLLPTLIVVLAVFGLMYCLIAFAGLRLRGPLGVWLAWVFYIPLATGACVYKLSGLGSDAPDLASIPYYAAVALAAIGLPLWFSSVVLLKLAARRPPVRVSFQIAGAWVAGIAASPFAMVLVAAADALANWLAMPRGS